MELRDEAIHIPVEQALESQQLVPDPAGYLIVYPDEDLPVGALGGWIRIEEIATDYYEYVKLSEGLLLGLRVTPIEYLSITGAYNPSRQRIAGDNRSESKNDRFLVSVTAHIAFGGAR